MWLWSWQMRFHMETSFLGSVFCWNLSGRLQQMFANFNPGQELWRVFLLSKACSWPLHAPRQSWQGFVSVELTYIHSHFQEPLFFDKTGNTSFFLFFFKLVFSSNSIHTWVNLKNTRVPFFFHFVVGVIFRPLKKALSIVFRRTFIRTLNNTLHSIGNYNSEAYCGCRLFPH